jgi:hypothetical protein
MHEREQDQQPISDLWDPNEHVGDIYEVEVNDEGGVERAERLQPSPRIWVGSWLDYNNGILYGEWTDAARDDDAIWTGTDPRYAVRRPPCPVRRRWRGLDLRHAVTEGEHCLWCGIDNNAENIQRLAYNDHISRRPIL